MLRNANSQSNQFFVFGADFAFSHGSAGDAEGEVGLTQAVEAAIFQHRSVAGEGCVGDVAENDLHVAQAGSHAAMGVGVAAGGDQSGLLLEEFAGRVGDDAALCAQSLKEMGYSNVSSIAGGFDAWQAAGFHVEKPVAPSFD